MTLLPSLTYYFYNHKELDSSVLSSKSYFPLYQSGGLGETFTRLLLRPESLLGSLSYTFQLLASYNDFTDYSVATVNVIVNGPPVGGFLSVLPRVGVALNTVCRFIYL
jgi:hypothetical protein